MSGRQAGVPGAQVRRVRSSGREAGRGPGEERPLGVAVVIGRAGSLLQLVLLDQRIGSEASALNSTDSITAALIDVGPAASRWASSGYGHVLLSALFEGRSGRILRALPPARHLSDTHSNCTSRAPGRRPGVGVPVSGRASPRCGRWLWPTGRARTVRLGLAPPRVVPDEVLTTGRATSHGHR